MSQSVVFFTDLKLAISSLQIDDLAPILLWACWLGILLIKLKGIDIRDDVTKICYVGVIFSIGCVMLIGLPVLWGDRRSPLESVLLGGFFIAAAYCRWILASSPSQFYTSAMKSSEQTKSK